MAGEEVVIFEKARDGENWRVRTEGGDVEGHAPGMGGSTPRARATTWRATAFKGEVHRRAGGGRGRRRRGARRRIRFFDAEGNEEDAEGHAVRVRFFDPEAPADDAEGHGFRFPRFKAKPVGEEDGQPVYRLAVLLAHGLGLEAGEPETVALGVVGGATQGGEPDPGAVFFGVLLVALGVEKPDLRGVSLHIASLVLYRLDLEALPILKACPSTSSPEPSALNPRERHAPPRPRPRCARAGSLRHAPSQRSRLPRPPCKLLFVCCLS